jgi:extracellular factor (EF) 3-hydroxypalmitic acid methyl ester biosynthesis protein
MVSMIARQAVEGGSLYAKVVNNWFLEQAPAAAHRNRLDLLQARLTEEAARVAREGRALRVFNVGCGPAAEIERFMRDSPLSDRAQFTLLDFNDETIRHSTAALEEARARHGRRTGLSWIRKSVYQLLKESGKTAVRPGQALHDFVYCAGLFDYLTDPVCQRLMEIMHTWLAPGGLLLVTNLDPSNPRRQTMEHVLDWNLVYRTGRDMEKLIPPDWRRDQCSIKADFSGVNLLLEARRPRDES